MGSWVAIAYGALDLDGLDLDVSETCVVLARKPSIPVFLREHAETLWRRLVDGPIDDVVLTPDERSLVEQFVEFGIASDDPSHPARISELSAPWLSSFAHELVYSMLASIAQEQGIRVVAIKGPVLYRQGLRTREHSGDVDILVDPEKADQFTEAIAEWGWTLLPTVWSGTRVKHGVTLLRDDWGCEIDVHWRMPGWALPDEAAFAEVHASAETVTFAGVPVPVPDLPTHAVISALHLARPQFKGPNEHIVHSARDVLATAGLDSLDAARTLRADRALAGELREAFPGETIEPTYPLPPDWDWRVQNSALRGNLAALRSLPWAQCMRVVSRFVWPSRFMVDDWQTRFGRTGGSSPWHGRMEWFKRLLRRAFR